MTKALVMRFGGIGDTAPVYAAARQLKKKGYEVHGAFRNDGGATQQTELYKYDDTFSQLFDFIEYGPWKTRGIPTKYGLVDIRSIYDDYDLVVNYMYSVEANNTSPDIIDMGPTGAWQISRNSNWFNWYDMALAWANIDPNSVPSDEKRPKFILSEEEKEASNHLRTNYSKVFVIHAHASSLCRTWYQAQYLPEMLLKNDPECGVFIWDNDNKCWKIHDKTGVQIVNMNFNSPVRQSMMIVSIADLFIGVDTGYAHIAEGLDVKGLVIYSTVPAWTRNKYYKYQVAIDPGENYPEFYTFSLTRGDPLREKDGHDSLSEREKTLLEFQKNRVPIEEAAKTLNTSPEGVDLEFRSLVAKMESWHRIQSKALSTVTPDMVMEKVKGIIYA